MEVADRYAVELRKPRPTDQGFVADSWVRNALQGDRRAVRSEVNRIVDRLLDDEAVRLLIANEPGQTNTILGWLAYTPLPSGLVVHFAYVRDRARRRGIGGQLLARALEGRQRKIFYTGRGPDAKWLAERYRDAIVMDMAEFLGGK